MKKALLTMGMPGAGKSTVISREYATEGWVVLDSDAIKKSLPCYNPKNPSLVHEISKKLVKAQLEETLENGLSFIYDTTGTNIARMSHDIKRFQQLGYFVEVLFVEVSLSTSIFRNSQRERVVPMEILLETWDELPEAVEILSPMPDKFTRINND